MKVILKFLITIVLTITILFSIAACLGNRDESKMLEQIINPNRDDFIGETLTIATLWDADFFSTLAQAYMSRNRGAKIEIINYEPIMRPDGNLSGVRQEINTQLMAGSAPTLFIRGLVDYFNPQAAQYLFDWFTLMNADPDFNEDDWFMNVFHAMTIENRLYAFPMFFNYDRVTVNTAIDGLYEMLEGRDGITINELMEIYNEMKIDNSYGFLAQFWLTRMLRGNINDFVDINTGHIEFGNDFIELITDAKSLVNFDYYAPSVFRNTILYEIDVYHGERYMFMYDDYSLVSRRLIPTYTHQYFKGTFPIVNDRGEIIIYSDLCVMLNANATPIQKALAWDFMKFIMTADNFPEGLSGFVLSTNRDLYYRLLRREIGMRDFFFHNIADVNIGKLIEEINVHFTKIAERPMAYWFRLPHFLIGQSDSVINVALRQFEEGLISAEDTAANLQSQVELIFMEMGFR